MGDQEDASREDKKPAPLPDLVQKAKDADAAVAANKKAASAWSLDRYNDIDAVREARKKNKPVPAKLQPRWPRSGTTSTRRTATSRRRWP